MASYRRLSDKTITRYKALEKSGRLTKRQRQLWDNHIEFVRIFDTGNTETFFDLFTRFRG